MRDFKEAFWHSPQRGPMGQRMTAVVLLALAWVLWWRMPAPPDHLPPPEAPPALLHAAAQLPPVEPASTATTATLLEAWITEEPSAAVAQEPVTPVVSWKHHLIRPGDTLSHLFVAQGIPLKQLHALLQAGPLSDPLHQLKTQHVLSLETSPSGTLHSLCYQKNASQALEGTWSEATGRWTLRDIPLPVERKQKSIHGQILDSFYLSAKRSGLKDALIMEVANLFAWDVDFIWGIRSGDRFDLVFEEALYHGNTVGSPRILAASFTNQNHEYRIYRHTHPHGEVNYYHEDGSNIKKAFLRTPVKHTRISSEFNLHRKHPLLHTIRAHRGVDYAAPEGTEIKTTGDGRVVFCGPLGGYGNVVKIQHGSRYTTVYAHLSRFAKPLKVGQLVRQGDIIGYVGHTGLATGPHLHYEFQIDGVHQNPLTVPLPQGKTLSAAEMEDFLKHKAQLDQLLQG